MIRKTHSLLYFAIIHYAMVAHSFAQPIQPKAFGFPMDTPLYLSAPFGSLRDNHFHSGSDIRTYEKTGLPVYAVADGYISRVKYASTAYGKALYITHPNGYTSVYAHLQQANGKIADYIRNYQYQQQTFEFDHFPMPNKLVVKKGDIIGWSGNTGTSTGPHLHFEIRDSKTEHIINPALFGIYGIDTLPPVIKQIVIYDLSADKPLILNKISISPNFFKQHDSVWYAKDTLTVYNGLIGFGIEAIDRLIDKKEYSIYGNQLVIDQKRVFEFQLNRFPFDKTKMIYSHIDYELFFNEGKRIQKLFIDDGNSIRLYPYTYNKGKFLLKDSLIHQVRIKTYDVLGNSHIVCMYIRGKPGNVYAKKVVLEKAPLFLPKKNNIWQVEGAKITVPPDALFDTVYWNYTMLSNEKGALGPELISGMQACPLFKNIVVELIPTDQKLIAPEKLLIASRNSNGTIKYIGGGYKQGVVSATASQAVDFFIHFDTTAPIIKPLFSKISFNDTVSIKFQISDSFSGIQTYYGKINGKWELFEYDAKNDLLEYFFVADSPTGKLDIEIFVMDKKGNTQLYTTNIIRK